MKLTKLANLIDMTDAEVLCQALQSTKILKERFSLNMPVRDCANGIYAAFNSEVKCRGGVMILDKDTRSHILSVAEWLTNPEGTPGVMLCGLYGNGKTTLAKAVQRFVYWATEIELGYSQSKNMRFIRAKEVCRMMKTDMKSYEKLFTEEMLIIDELGEEPSEVMSFGSVETPMLDLLSERYERNLLTIITTNLTTDEIKAKYGARIFDRFKEMMTSIVFENASYRQRQ